mgnify:CR=1 FL=1
MDAQNKQEVKNTKIKNIKNKGAGVHRAITSGFEESAADAVLVFPADDTFNANIIDIMYLILFQKLRKVM